MFEGFYIISEISIDGYVDENNLFLTPSKKFIINDEFISGEVFVNFDENPTSTTDYAIRSSIRRK